MAQLKSTRIFGTIKSFALTQSTSVDTGALIIAGGVGIKKNLNVGGSSTIIGTLGVTGAVSGAKFNKVTITPPTNGSVLTILDGKTLTVNQTLTLTGTDSTAMTFPSATDTVMGLGATQTVSGAKKFNSEKLILNGSISGTTVLNASATATGTLVFPAVLVEDTLVGRETIDTLTNKTLTSPIINDIKASAISTNADLWSEITTGSINIGAPNSGNYTTTINSGSGGLNIGTDINYSRPIIIGSTTGTTSVNIKTASGGLSLDDFYTGTHTVNLATGNTDISKTKTIYIGTGGVTSSTTNITLGSTAGLGSTVINSGIGGVKIGNNSPYNSVDIGNTLGTSSISIETKTGTLNLNSTSTDTHTINIGTGTTASSKTKTIYIGTGGVNGSTTNITLGSTTGVGSTVINSPTAIKIPRLNVIGAMYISNTDGTLASEATLAASRGGTGTGTYVVGDILYASTTTALSRLAKGDSGKVLKMGALIPEWGNDNNNTYSAGTGLSLSGTSFSVDYGKTDTTACVGNDTRLSDDRTPLSHKHGNITNDGKIGTTPDLVVVTGDGGSVSAKTAGTTSQYLRGDGSWVTPPNTNYYPDTFSWTGGTTDGPTGSLSGTGMTAVGFGAIPSASTTASGIVTTGAQTFSGNKTISGDLSANKVYNAVWNDIADFLEVDEDTDIEYGKAYFRDNNGKVRKTNKRNSYSIGIASDTFGFGVGRKDENIKQIPIAIGGWVIAYVDNVYKAGTAMVASKNGILKKASILDKILFPERIIAIFDRVEKEETWNGVEVKGRHWVKVK